MEDTQTMFTAECPMSWCEYSLTVEKEPNGKIKAANLMTEHVNTTHSIKDIKTLIDS